MFFLGLLFLLHCSSIWRETLDDDKQRSLRHCIRHQLQLCVRNQFCHCWSGPLSNIFIIHIYGWSLATGENLVWGFFVSVFWYLFYWTWYPLYLLYHSLLCKNLLCFYSAPNILRSRGYATVCWTSPKFWNFIDPRAFNEKHILAASGALIVYLSFYCASRFLE